jgi:hypothetical protein
MEAAWIPEFLWFLSATMIFRPYQAVGYRIAVDSLAGFHFPGKDAPGPGVQGSKLARVAERLLCLPEEGKKNPVHTAR